MARQGERPSRTWGPPGWESSWRAAALLAAASILSPCIQLTGAQSSTNINIEVTVVPSKPTIGQSIILTPGGAPNFDSCSWYRGASMDATTRIFTYYPPPNPHQQNGVQHTGRETGEPGCSLRIENLRADDSGTYTVSKSGRAIPLEEGRVAIMVSEDVFNITISGPSKAIEKNIGIVLTCTSEDTRVSYYWLKGTQSPEVPGRISLSSNNQTLTFREVLRGDSGDYACYGFNSSYKVGVVHHLEVIYGPDVPEISPADQDYSVGATLSLSCNADSNPPAQYTWLVNGTVVQHASQLLLYNLSLSNSGTYTCRAVNSETGATNISKKITVWEKLSSPVLWPADSVVMESTKVILNCSDSVSVVSWFKDGKPLAAQPGPDFQNQTLSLGAVTREDTGVYTCEDRNPVSSAMSNPSNLVVAYGPNSVALNQKETVAHELGSHLALVCTADSSPMVHFQWLFNDAEQNVTGNSFIVQLEDWKDQGNYTCQATNPFTRRSASASVHVTLTKDPGRLDAGAIAGIVVGSLAVVGLVVGTLLYFFLRPCGRKSKETPTPDIPVSPPYERIFPPIATRVRPDTGPVPRHVYENPQNPGNRNQHVYEPMRAVRDKFAKTSSPAPGPQAVR